MKISVYGVAVCKDMFLFAHRARAYVLKRVQVHVEVSTCGHTPWHALSPEDDGNVQAFIGIYASVHGLPQPAVLRGHNGPAPIM